MKRGGGEVCIEGLSHIFRRQISLFHKKPFRVLEDINLSLEKGSLTVLWGPNGSGKTTLLKIVAGLIRPAEGSVWVGGFSVQDHPLEVHRRIGMVAGGNGGAWYARLTALENLRVFAAAHGLYGQKLQERISELAERLGIIPELSRRVQELSQGMRARLNLLRALVHDPPILLLDEPFQSIDAEQMSALKGWIYQNLLQEQGKTILFVSHRREEFLGWEGKLLILEKGRIWREDRIENLAVQQPFLTQEVPS